MKASEGLSRTSGKGGMGRGSRLLGLADAALPQTYFLSILTRLKFQIILLCLYWPSEEPRTSRGSRSSLASLAKTAYRASRACMMTSTRSAHTLESIDARVIHNLILWGVTASAVGVLRSSPACSRPTPELSSIANHYFRQTL